MKSYQIKCTDEEREKMKLLVQNCKISSKETVAQVIIRALSKLKVSDK